MRVATLVRVTHSVKLFRCKAISGQQPISGLKFVGRRFVEHVVVVAVVVIVGVGLRSDAAGRLR